MKASETIANKKTGERLTMLVNEEEKRWFPGNCTGIPSGKTAQSSLHDHVAFTETFTVLEGALDF